MTVECAKMSLDLIEGSHQPRSPARTNNNRNTRVGQGGNRDLQVGSGLGQVSGGSLVTVLCVLVSVCTCAFICLCMWCLLRRSAILNRHSHSPV